MYTICPTVHCSMRAWKIILIEVFDDLFVICSTMHMKVRSCGTSLTRKHILLKLWSGYVNGMLHRVTSKRSTTTYGDDGHDDYTQEKMDASTR